MDEEERWPTAGTAWITSTPEKVGKKYQYYASLHLSINSLHFAKQTRIKG
jgi:hypothetical protein